MLGNPPIIIENLLSKHSKPLLAKTWVPESNVDRLNLNLDTRENVDWNLF